MMPAEASDFAAFPPHPFLRGPRFGFALRFDGEPVALGIIATHATAGRMCFFDRRRDVEISAIVLHRFAKRALAAALERGYSRFLTYADKAIEKAEPWLLRLGFKRVGDSEMGPIYEWAASDK